mmetsp:Transcript_27819/g.69929  ORF Transcript_27819/g.69929 Transcript_27819/m.69929 type:complete len:103 (+) Transcript_27819:204-512(+)
MRSMNLAATQNSCRLPGRAIESVVEEKSSSAARGSASRKIHQAIVIPSLLLFPPVPPHRRVYGLLKHNAPTTNTILKKPMLPDINSILGTMIFEESFEDCTF